MAFKMKGFGGFGDGTGSSFKKETKSPPKGRIGSEYRKKEYDARGWKYDDTIAGYNRDGTKKKDRWEIGLLAQEALTAEQAHTSKTGSGDDEGVIVQGSENRTYNMSYQKIIMPLIKSVKELDAQLAALTTRVAALE